MTWRSEHPIEPVVEGWNLDLSRHILELGPGVGQLAPLVAAAGGSYYGVDFDARAGVTLLDYEQEPRLLPRYIFGGIFARNSIAAHWINLPLLVRAIHVRMGYSAWGWISLWIDPERDVDVDGAVKLFESIGCVRDDTYHGENQVLVTRGLS